MSSSAEIAREMRLRKRSWTKFDVAAPEETPKYEGLRGKQLEQTIKADQRIRKIITEGDLRLLEQALKQQFIENLVVYGLCGVIFCLGVILFFIQATRPQPLAINKIQLESTDSAAKGKAVDLDDLKVSWEATGEITDLKVYLENIETGRHSNVLNASSTDGNVIFRRDAYSELLSDRQAGEKNRLRVILQGPKSVFKSDACDLIVGITILGFYDPGRRTIRLCAMIDQSLVQDYVFEAKALVWTKGSPPEVLSFGGTIHGMQDFVVNDPDAIRWDTLKVVYLGPKDGSIIRTSVPPT